MKEKSLISKNYCKTDIFFCHTKNRLQIPKNQFVVLENFFLRGKKFVVLRIWLIFLKPLVFRFKIIQKMFVCLVSEFVLDDRFGFVMFNFKSDFSFRSSGTFLIEAAMMEVCMCGEGFNLRNV